MDVPDLKKHNTPDAGQKGQIAIKEEPKSEDEDDIEEPEQLRTPAESPSGASVHSVPDLTDDTVATEKYSPETFNSPLNTDIISTGSFSSSSGKEPSSLLMSIDNTISPTDSNLSMSGFDDMFNLNFDANYEWMINNDWTRDAFAM